MQRLLLILCFTVFLASGAIGGQSRSSKISKANPCPHGIDSELFRVNLQSGHVISTVNPFDNIGRCYEIERMDVLQILARNKALCGGRMPFALVDFGKESAPPNYFKGIVKGKGAYQYESAGNGLVTVHYFRLLSEAEQQIVERQNRIK